MHPLFPGHVGSLLLHTPVGTSGWQALAWCGGILVVSAGMSGVAFRKRTG